MAATVQGKEFALAKLRARRERSKGASRINNADLPAGAPMYFYCVTCGGLADTKPEGYFTPPRKLCGECEALKAAGWLE